MRSRNVDVHWVLDWKGETGMSHSVQKGFLLCWTEEEFWLLQVINRTQGNWWKVIGFSNRQYTKDFEHTPEGMEIERWAYVLPPDMREHLELTMRLCDLSKAVDSIEFWASGW